MKRLHTLLTLLVLFAGIAAAQGQSEYLVGLSYYKGINNTKQDYAQAVYWWQKAADKGSAAAQYYLGLCSYRGTGLSQDYAQAVAWYEKAAVKGLAVAQYSLGLCYEQGEGVAQDYAQAAAWYEKAAEQGFATAQYCLGLCYINGRGVAKDYAQAVAWLEKAAEQGDSDAQNVLGVCYCKARGVAQDYGRAIFWFTKSAAQCNLARRYFRGEGVRCDVEMAKTWWQKSAAQGLGQSQLELGCVCYDEGAAGQAGSYEQAARYLGQALEQANEGISGAAAFLLSKCYRFGRGVPQDVDKADALLEEAKDKGCVEAKTLDELLKEIIE